MAEGVVGVVDHVTANGKACQVVVRPAGARKQKSVARLDNGGGKVEVAVDGGKCGAIVEVFSRV